MKAFLNLCCAVSFTGVISIAGGKSDLPFFPQGTAEQPREVNRSMPSGAMVFNPHVRSKIVQYFDTYPAGKSRRFFSWMPIQSL